MRRFCALAVVVLAAPGLLAQEPQAALTAVAVNAGPTVVISGAGPLPVPQIGVLRAPDRIYLDLAGVSSRALSAAGDGTLVLSVRAAQHSLDPAVARIVIDLKQPCRYSLNAARRGSGRLELALTSGPVSSQPPVARATPPPGSGNAGKRRYVAIVQPALDRLGIVRAVLHDIDAGASVTPERLQAASSELTRFSQTVDAITPSRGFEDTHDLLKSVVGFASTALRLSADPSASRNAASAAAGATLMLDRAEAELRK